MRGTRSPARITASKSLFNIKPGQVAQAGHAAANDVEQCRIPAVVRTKATCACHAPAFAATLTQLTAQDLPQ